MRRIQRVEQVSIRSACGVDARLSARETEIIDLLLQGFTDAQIGQALYISVRTVNTYVASILSKLGAQNRTQVVYLYLWEQIESLQGQLATVKTCSHCGDRVQAAVPS